MRKTWTDERLDDYAIQTGRRFDMLEHRMENGFNRVDADIRDLRGEMNTRFDSLQRTLLQIGGGVIVALVGLIATQL